MYTIRNRAGSVGWTTLILLMCVAAPTSLMAQEDPEANSIASIGSRNANFILEHRGSKARVRGRLISFSSTGATIQPEGENSRNYSWDDYQLLFGDGLTNAAELLNEAKRLIDEVENALGRAKFSPQRAESLESLQSRLDQAASFARRIKVDYSRRLPLVNVLPTITAEDRQALTGVELILDKLNRQYNAEVFKSEYEFTMRVRLEINKLWSNLTSFYSLVDNSRFQEAKLELERHRDRLIGKAPEEINEEIIRSLAPVLVLLEKLGSSLQQLEDTELTQLPDLRKKWVERGQILSQGMQHIVAGPKYLAAFTKHVEQNRSQIEELDRFIQEAQAFSTISRKIDLLEQRKPKQLSEVERSQTELASVMAEFEIEQQKWKAAPPSIFRDYLLKRIGVAAGKLKLIPKTLEFKAMELQAALLFKNLQQLKNANDARMLSVELNKIHANIDQLVKTPELTLELRQEFRKTLFDVERGRDTALETEFGIHQAQVANIKESLNRVLAVKSADVPSQHRLLSDGQQQLASTTISVEELGNLLPVLRPTVQSLVQEVRQLQQEVPGVLNVLSIRANLHQIRSELEALNDFERVEQELATHQARLQQQELEIQGELTKLVNWTKEDLAETQLEIQRIRPLRMFDQESTELEATLADLVDRVSTAPLLESRLAAAEVREKFQRLSKWIDEHPPLQHASNRAKLQKLQLQQATITQQLTEQVYRRRKQNGWLELPGQPTQLLPPTPENREWLELLQWENSEPLLDSATPTDKAAEINELAERLLLRQAQELESRDILEQASQLYEEVRVRTTSLPRLQAAAETGKRRTTTAIQRLREQEASRRRMLIIATGGIGLALMILTVLYLQSKPVRLIRAKRLLERANRERARGNTEQADNLVQLCSRIVASYPIDDPEVQMVLSILDESASSTNHRAQPESTVPSVTPPTPEEPSWLCHSLVGSEASICTALDGIESRKGQMKKKDRSELCQWLVQQFEELLLRDHTQEKWLQRELARAVDLFPESTAIRMNLVQLQLANQHYRDALQAVLPLLKSTKRGQQKIYLQANELAAEALIGLEDWTQLSKLTENYERRTKRPFPNSWSNLAAVGSQLKNNEQADSKIDLEQFLDKLLA